jgi:hypothetical protein
MAPSPETHLIEARRAPALAALRTLPRVRPTEPPGWAVQSCLTGTKSQGRAYEKKVGKILAKLCIESNWTLHDHQWFIYTQGVTVKYFQPDFIIERPGQQGVLIEAKLTWVDTSLQLNKYLEYLKILGLICFPLTVVRNLTPSVSREKIVDDFTKIYPHAVWHLWV